ncbi:PREDICTED: protein trichome birefringence-like 19 [Ipomoea nil]|uniref:protein trichome birefringence-like 19 n=1 Tax=Ipomoea nil TaxID=35883 RepID=UPI000900E1A2|nr:PREDICTED: protein trichome birefringence-like 19 [Ipomoea nil]
MDMDFPSAKKPTIHKTPKIILPLALTIIFLTVFPLYYTFNRTPNVEVDLYPPNQRTSEEIGADLSRSPPKAEPRRIRTAESVSRCDIFAGEWVPNPEAPYYTNDTCWGIQEHQNCMKFGRPDNGYLKWRWRPDGCELPVFDPFDFLELVRGKALAFVGDSIARNHMQSLVCLLSRVTYPLDVSETKDDNRKSFVYRDYDFNITMFWSPYLVKTGETFSEINTNPFNLYLDEFDESWTTKIKDFDYVIINAGHWFFRPTSFYLEGKLVGCLYCSDPNITQLSSAFSYQRALRTAFRAINSLENFKGVTFLRSFAPQHFEHGPWDQGGECVRTVPFRRNDSALSEFKFDSYDIQREEFRIAEEEARQKGTRLRLFDVTQAMLLRPDGHPNKYGHWQNPNVTNYNDCVHWCLPGPIDTWGDFFLELLKREVQDRSSR